MSLMILLKSYSLYLIVRLNIVSIILKSYKVFVETFKELLFINNNAIKYSLYNPVNVFANLLIIFFTGIVN